MTEPAWKRRFRGPRFSFPQGPPERIVSGGNHGGRFEVYLLELTTNPGEHVCVRPGVVEAVWPIAVRGRIQ